MILYTSQQVRQIGLEAVGFDHRRQRFGIATNRRFKSHFGSSELVLQVMWRDLQLVRFVPNATETHFLYFLMTMYFLKKYDTMEGIAGRFGCHKNTAMNWIWYFAEAIQFMKQHKIKFTTELTDNSMFPLTVDGVHCRINEPQHPVLGKNPVYYSHKFNQAGLAYELALSTTRNALVWINGPFPASTHDKTIFSSSLETLIPNGKRAIADSAYRSSPKIAYSNSADNPVVRQFKGRAKARQEAFNARIKNFNCLSERFRHALAKHKICFEAVCVICQYQLETDSPLFDV